LISSHSFSDPLKFQPENPIVQMITLNIASPDATAAAATAVKWLNQQVNQIKPFVLESILRPKRQQHQGLSWATDVLQNKDFTFPQMRLTQPAACDRIEAVFQEIGHLFPLRVHGSMLLCPSFHNSWRVRS
jgi:hypothetical protein